MKRPNLLTYQQKKRAASILVSVCRYVFLIGLSYIVLYPIMYMISNAFKPVKQYHDPSIVWIPKSFTMENFKQVALLMEIPQMLLNTVIIGVIPAIISTITCMMYGYGLARFRFRGRAFVTVCLFLTIIIPQQTISTSLYSVYRNFDVFGILELLHFPRPNLIGSPWVTILPSIFGMGLKNGMFVFIYMQFFVGLPKELEEAAWIDGASPFRAYWKVVVPTATNVSIAVLLLSIVWNWNDYFTPAMFIRTRETFSTFMQKFKEMTDTMTSRGFGYDDFLTADTQNQAACLITIIPLLILYVALQKQFAEGIENSGLTGL